MQCAATTTLVAFLDSSVIGTAGQWVLLLGMKSSSSYISLAVCVCLDEEQQLSYRHSIPHPDSKIHRLPSQFIHHLMPKTQLQQRQNITIQEHENPHHRRDNPRCVHNIHVSMTFEVSASLLEAKRRETDRLLGQKVTAGMKLTTRLDGASPPSMLRFLPRRARASIRRRSHRRKSVGRGRPLLPPARACPASASRVLSSQRRLSEHAGSARVGSARVCSDMTATAASPCWLCG